MAARPTMRSWSATRSWQRQSTRQGQRQRTVTLPPGRWIDFWEDTAYAGGQTVTLDAPLERMPILVRAGSAIPAWPTMQHTGERPIEKLTLHLYAGTANSVLYEDDGRTWAHQQGDYLLTKLAATLEEQANGEARLTVRRTTEGSYTPGYDRIEVAVHGLEGEITEIRIDGQAAETCARSLSVAPFHTLEIRISPHPAATEERAASRRSGDQ